MPQLTGRKCCTDFFQTLAYKLIDDYKTFRKPIDSDQERSDKVLKRKHEEEENPPPRPPPAPPGRDECDRVQSTLPSAPIKSLTDASCAGARELICPKQTMTPDATASTPPTLVELAAKKLIDTLLKSDDPIHAITSMERHEQSLLLPYLSKEYNRLRTYQHDHKHSGEYYFPEADRALFLHDGTKISRPQDETSGGGGENGYILRQRFIKEWEYSDDEKSGKGVHWDDDCLYREDSRLAPFCLCNCAEQSDKYPYQRNCKEHPHNKLRHLYRCISSPLLLYRLTAVFGMPPPVVDDQYKTSWETRLQWIGDDESTIRFGESKGGTYAYFGGSPKASESALKLLDFLVSDNIPHAYDGVLVGSVVKTSSRKAVFRNDKPLPDSVIIDQQDHLLSPEFWKKYRELCDFEDKHKPSCNAHYFPDADRVLFMHDGSRISDATCQDNPYYARRRSGRTIKDRFLKQWGFYPDSYRGQSYTWQLEYELERKGVTVAAGQEKVISWDSDDLYREDSKLKFQICDLDQALNCQKHQHRPFHEYISSQLLYYRLIAIFDMPPAVRTDQNESCWEATLYKYGDKGTRLVFGELKGGAKVSFRGSLEASKSALKMLDWLISDNIPHNYDGVLAGSIA